jgi:uncharacterized membrane protein
MGIVGLQTHLHGMIVHFPIALLFTSVLLELLALHRPWQERLRMAALITLVLGTLGALAAVITGPDEMARGVTELGETHEHFAQVTLALFALLTVWRVGLLWLKRAFSGAQVIAYVVLACVGVGLLGYTGFLGGTMVYEKAVGVRVNGQLVQPPTRGHGGGRD